jgi:hypothetical protein
MLREGEKGTRERHSETLTGGEFYKEFYSILHEMKFFSQIQKQLDIFSRGGGKMRRDGIGMLRNRGWE